MGRSCEGSFYLSSSSSISRYNKTNNMPNLKLIGMRLKSVTNIQKITQSMKMVSAAKFARAEKDLRAARPLGSAAKAFYEQAEVGTDKEAPKELYVTINSDKTTVYDSLDADVVQSYLEFSLASLIFYTMKEGATSEQSSRMTAMDNSSKNASEMIDKLRITFNRTRQAVITGELIEIISGAA